MPEVVDGNLSGIEKVRLRRYATRERANEFLPGIVQLLRRDLPLSSQNLPESYLCLKDSKCICAQGDIGSPIEGVHHAEETRNGNIVQSLEFRKNQVLIAVPGEFLGQQASRFRTHPLIGRTRCVDRAQHQKDRQGSVVRSLAGEGE